MHETAYSYPISGDPPASAPPAIAPAARRPPVQNTLISRAWSILALLGLLTAAVAVRGRCRRTARRLSKAVQRQGPHRLARHAALRSVCPGRHARGQAKAKHRRLDRRRQATLERRERGTGQRRRRRVPDDRQGLRRHRIARGIQDGALGRQRHLPPRHATGADLGLYQGGRQVEPRRRQGQRRPVEQQPRLARQGPASPGRQAVRPVEQVPHPPGGRAGDRLSERQASRRSCPAGELLAQAA